MTTALCHGYFSALHYGHLEMFRYARAIADKVVVSVARTSKQKKTDIPAELRASLVAVIKDVDAVLIFEDGPHAILAVEPDFYIKGPTYEMDTPHEDRQQENSAAQQLGCRIIVMERWKKWAQASEEIKHL